MDITQKTEEILEAVLAGYSSPAAVAEQVFASADAKLCERIRKLMATVEFNRRLQQAKEDLIGTAVESFRRTVLRNVQAMKELALQDDDKRIKFSANKDILDRVGLAPAQKVDARFTPVSYDQILKEYEARGEETEAEPEDVVQEAELYSEEGSEGS